nr:retrovirus-related Pol polyprotein from transposon TNT 1-94 [Tanacetum cinerariifolium]
MALLSMRADRFWKKTGKKISIQGTDVARFDKSKVKCFNCHKMGHFTRECRAPRSQDRGRKDNYRQGSMVEEQDPKALMAINGDLSWTGLPEFVDDTVTDYSRPSPAIESTSDDVQNRNPFVTNTEASPSIISFKPFIKKFPTGNTKFSTTDMVNKGKAGNSQNHIDDKGYWDSGCSRHMTGNISYLSEYEPYDGGYVSFGQGGCKITGKGTIKTEIENLKELRVKIIKCDNRGEFRNKEIYDFCLRKGIKREFSNARTPQQNGVAEKINRTLIEAARTMLADAKLPITFWAEAVNNACYVQNRVLVNKPQNKTPYELFNGRSPAIGFLKPFGCHVMILNTLDNLGKFEAKGDEGYFLGYSMSSKAFRVFNKRTKRVEENLHVDFLENKPIEKGAGLNWLFVIDSLTNSMNYVLVVVADTNSTNFSGTKEAACQNVKKDVSTLRYIVLPNWFYEAHLESSTSNAQDTCSADAPESSGNSNPTATSTNPPADHMETLAVETPIPTISSPVPTACLNDFPEPSSDTRLISKKVTSQDDMPSLDNILALTNMFEDILGVTTNTDDTNEVEADLDNMETTIIASHTPTFKNHKDHLKSQIIGPAPRAWYGTLSKYLLTHGFQRGTIDQTLFIRRYKGDFILLQVYVDDIIFGSSNPQLCREIEALMHEKFQMSAMGELNFFLGLQVLQKEDAKNVTDLLTKPFDAGRFQYLVNTDFHPIVDFVKASHIRYALTFNPTVYVSHIRQFWSTARIETTEEGTKILATIDGKLRTVFESSIRRNLKHNDKAGISSLPDAKLFENLTQMGYNISPNQKFTFQKGQFSHQ